MVNTSVIIQARMGSKRLPGKSIKKIGNYTVIEWIFERLKLCKNVDDIILATTTQKKDTILCEMARKNNIKFFRGSEENVLKRYIDAAQKHNVDNIIRVCADRPFIDPSLIDQLVQNFDHNEVDLLFNHKSSKYNFWPIGFGAEIFNSNKLQGIYRNDLKQEYKEHVSLIFYEEKYLTVKSLLNKHKLKNFNKIGKFDLDTIEDLIKLKNLAKYIVIEDNFEIIIKKYLNQIKSETQ